MKPLLTIAVLPTMFTLGNLMCGFFSIVIASRIEAPTSVTVPTASVVHRIGPARVPPGDHQRSLAHPGRQLSELLRRPRAEDDPGSGGKLELHAESQPGSPGNTLWYLMLLRGSAIISATASRHLR